MRRAEDEEGVSPLWRAMGANADVAPTTVVSATMESFIVI